MHIAENCAQKNKPTTPRPSRVLTLPFMASVLFATLTQVRLIVNKLNKVPVSAVSEELKEVRWTTADHFRA